MSDIHTDGSSTYQTGTNDTYTALVDNTDDVEAKHQNGPAAAIIGMQTILGVGTTLKGSLADLATRLAVSIEADGTLTAASSLHETGDIITSARSSKTGWLLMDDSERSNTTYEDLLDVLIANINTASSSHWLKAGTSVGTATFDESSDEVTISSHGLSNNAPIYFQTTGALPSELSANTKYYVLVVDDDTIQVESSVGGGAIDFTDNGSATTNCYNSFICDMRGRIGVGADNMGGSSANRLSETEGDNVGQSEGDEDGVAAHTHSPPNKTYFVEANSGIWSGWTSQVGSSQQAPTFTTATGSTGTSSGNMPPYGTMNYFIKT